MGLYIQFDNIVGNKTIPQHYLCFFTLKQGKTGSAKNEYPKGAIGISLGPRAKSAANRTYLFPAGGFAANVFTLISSSQGNSDTSVELCTSTDKDGVQ
jgi:hypothetical protein